MAIPWYLPCWLAAFLVGSIPFAVILGRLNGVDVRTIGSGNPGATNLGRALGRKWGALCFVLDVGKGLIPTLAFGLVVLVLSVRHGMGFATDIPEPARPIESLGSWLAIQWVLIAIAAVAGHIFSPFLKFKGGKGVATGLGATLGLFPIVTIPAVIAFAIWYAVCKITGYVGLASVIAAGVLPILTALNGLVIGFKPAEVAVYAGFTALLAALVIARHKANIKRLLAGTEPKAAWTGKGETHEKHQTQETPES